jgi:predicted Zn-dependent protease
MNRTVRRWPYLAALAIIAGCATNPVTGKKEFSLISESQEISMGQEGKQGVLQSSAVVPDSSLQRYVSGLGTRFASHSERPSLPWSFIVLDDPAVNAFALPGGPIFITRGILTYMNSEAELVSVLGHEMGHVTARHSASQLSKAQLAQIGLVAGMVVSPQFAKLGDLASTGLSLLFLKFSRDDETQADELGFKYSLAEGYDVREMASMFRTLERLSGDEGRLPEWQSTHPDPGNRVAVTEQRVASLNRSMSGLRVAREEFLAHVDGLVFGDNPREGFFQGNVYHHPDLRFRFDFPAGWKTQNQTTQVAGMSSQQDAIIAITPGGNGSPSQLLSQFLGQQGMQAGRTSNQPINGSQAAVGEFAAPTDQGNVQGIVAFISYNGTMYRILAYTPQQRASAYSNVFLQAINSFRAETDPAVLSVKPNYVRLVKLPRAMTITEFNTAYPSAIPLEQLAVINGVAATATIPAGTTVKRVVTG